MSPDVPPSETGRDLLSVVVPAYNEAAGVTDVLKELLAVLDQLPCDSEVIVVDDGSRDDTAAKVAAVPGVRLVRNPINLGYGHSLIRGFAAARGNLLGMIDADGTYPVEALPDLYAMIKKGADHAIGQRTGKHFERLIDKRRVYRLLCSYVVGQRVPDANSGLRMFRREVYETLRGDLCRGFSFTTSLTLASLMSGYVVTNTPMPYHRRVGRSHVRFRDVLRTLQYLFQLVAVYNPLKLFLPFVVASALCALAGLGYGLWRPSNTGLLAFVVMVATSFLLVGLASLAYIQSRMGLAPVRPPPPPEAEVAAPPAAAAPAEEGKTTPSEAPAETADA